MKSLSFWQTNINNIYAVKLPNVQMRVLIVFDRFCTKFYLREFLSSA